MDRLIIVITAAVRSTFQAMAAAAIVSWQFTRTTIGDPHVQFTVLVIISITAPIGVAFFYYRYRAGWVSVLVERKLSELGLVGPWKLLRKLLTLKFDVALFIRDSSASLLRRNSLMRRISTRRPVVLSLKLLSSVFYDYRACTDYLGVDHISSGPTKTCGRTSKPCFRIEVACGASGRKGF